MNGTGLLLSNAFEWRRSRDLHALTLSSAEIRRLIEALGGQPSENFGSLAESLTELLRGGGEADAVVEAATR
jgi:hypothetical protein